jgi:4-hydroxy-3-methylbut-2-enyl diphosphate reductase IspH
MKKKTKIIVYGILIVALILLIIGGIFIYNQKTKEAFGQSYNNMNVDYKNVLFASGQEKPETSTLMSNYKKSFQAFYSSYNTNPLSPYSKDIEWKNSLDKISTVIAKADILIKDNKSKEAHLELEKVRQVWQETFKRNNVTMLGFYLTEFHDIMEKAIEESDKKNFEKLYIICVDMNNAWAEVVNTQTEFSNNQEYIAKISEETSNVNKFCDAVKNRQDTVKDLSANLKSTFVPFYLKYG